MAIKHIFSLLLITLYCAAHAAPTTLETEPWRTYASKARSWANIPGAIYFYDIKKPYAEFIPQWQVNVLIDGKVWPTIEQYYQAMKFTDSALQETIRNFTSDALGSAAHKALEFAHTHQAQVRKDWPTTNLNIKRKALRAAFDQHRELREKLLNTGNAVLVYATTDAHDTLYGTGTDYKGKNWYGRLLMALRDDLRKQSTSYKHQTITPESRAKNKQATTTQATSSPTQASSALSSLTQAASAIAAIPAPAATQSATTAATSGQPATPSSRTQTQTQAAQITPQPAAQASSQAQTKPTSQSKPQVQQVKSTVQPKKSLRSVR